VKEFLYRQGHVGTVYRIDTKKKMGEVRGISISALNLRNVATAGSFCSKQHCFIFNSQWFILTFRICVIPSVFKRSARLAWSKLPINRKPGITSVGKALGVCMSAFSSIWPHILQRSPPRYFREVKAKGVEKICWMRVITHITWAEFTWRHLVQGNISWYL